MSWQEVQLDFANWWWVDQWSRHRLHWCVSKLWGVEQMKKELDTMGPLEVEPDNMKPTTRIHRNSASKAPRNNSDLLLCIHIKDRTTWVTLHYGNSTSLAGECTGIIVSFACIRDKVHTWHESLPDRPAHIMADVMSEDEYAYGCETNAVLDI